ncbi:hypothetical protein AQ436_00070 [Arthrobacter sp. EpRS66]|nr:hypothetical protein AQ436_00070 [Arthrobacter sp. EpRS66]
MAEIPSTPYDGNYKAVFVATLADLNAISAAAVTAGDDLSCYFTGDGLQITVDEQTITDERMCSRSTFEKRGRKTHAIQTTYIDNTNSVAHASSNLATETLAEGTVGYLVTRRNKAYEDAFAAADIVRAYPVEAGFQAEVPGEANSVTRITQKLFVTGDPAIDVALVA